MTTISPPTLPPAGAGPAPGRPPGRLPMTPGRRVALLLGVPVVLAVLAANGFSLVQNLGKGSFPVNYSTALGPGPLTVDVGGGDATVRSVAASAASASVRGTVTYELARPTLRLSANTLGLDCAGIDTGNCSLNGTVTVDAPAGDPLTVNTDGGALSVSALTGPGTLDTGGGDLTASSLAGPDTLNADGGTIAISGDTADLNADSGGGDITLSQVSGASVALNADGGNVTGKTVTTPQFTVDSGGGDVTLTFTTIPGDVRVNSDGGDVQIVVPPHAYRLNENSDGGNVTAFASASGSGDVISVDSGGGDIDVEQSGS